MFMPAHAPMPNTTARTRAATPIPLVAVQNSSHLLFSVVAVLGIIETLFWAGVEFGAGEDAGAIVVRA